jgi:plastocyanin
VGVIATNIQDIWNGIIGVLEQLVTPDWGAIVAFLPVALALVAIVFYGWQVRRWATAGPTHRGLSPQPPLPPAGLHAPGPSFAPIFAAFGAFLTFFGLIIGGIALWLGVIALVLTLLYWLREAVADYESHVEATRVLVPAEASSAPPGVHMPAPSFRPILVSLSACVVFAGLVAGTPILVAGILLLTGSLIGWLRDARVEYTLTEVADRTGHLAAGPTPHFPGRSLAVGVGIVGLAVVLNSGILTSIQTAAPGATNAPGASGAAAGSPAASAGGGAVASAGASSQASPVAADVTITAKGIQYTTKDVVAKAGTPFTIAFQNEDAGVPHNVQIKDASGQSVFKGDIVSGVTTTVYHVPELKAGTYTFVCDVHPNMTGTLTVK